MSLSPVGFILLPVALVLFVRGRRSLLWGTLLSAPFTAAAVADVGVTTVKVFQLFGGLFIVRCLLDRTWTRTGILKKSWANGLSLLFLFVCFLSLSMAVVHAGAVDVYTETQGRWIDVVLNKQPLQLSSFNFTQIIYPVFGVLLFHFVAREIQSRKDLRSAVRLLVWGGAATGAMTIIGGILYTIGLGASYTNFLRLFTIGAAGIKTPEIGSLGQFFRVYTVAGEPGFTAMSLLLSLGLLLGLTIGAEKRRRSIVRFSGLLFFVLATALLFNGSTTGYFGAFLLIVWSVIATAYFNRSEIVNFSRLVPFFLGILAVLAVAGALLQVAGTSFLKWFAEYHLAKLQGEGVGSGQIRAHVTWYTLREVFLTNPILGVGYGSHLSLSMATFLLSNVGLLGFGIFLAFLFVVFRNVSTVVRASTGEFGTMAFAAVLTLPPFFGTLFVAKATSAMNYGITWILIALSEAIYQAYRKNTFSEAA